MSETNETKKKSKQQGFYKPKDGMSWSPLLKGNLRNELCQCGSGKKFKKCHLSQVSPVVPTKGVQNIKDGRFKFAEFKNEETFDKAKEKDEGSPPRAD